MKKVASQSTPPNALSPMTLRDFGALQSELLVLLLRFLPLRRFCTSIYSSNHTPSLGVPDLYKSNLRGCHLCTLLASFILLSP